MPPDKPKGSKGFAGLDSMISDVEVTPAPPQPARRDPQPSAAAPAPPPIQRQAPAHSEPASTGGGSGKWWAIGIGIVILIAMANGSSKKSTSAASYSSGSQPSYSAPARTPAYEPAAVDTSSKEERPPVGSGMTFNRSQIRYCLSEKIRVSAWQEQVNNYSQTSVDAFNAAVDDYNSRCSSFRYRSGSLESVRSEVEARRYSLQLEGAQNAMLNP